MPDKTIYDLLDEYAEENLERGMLSSDGSYAEWTVQSKKCEKVRKEICDWLFYNSN